MVHSLGDHMKDRPSGWHTFDLGLARYGKTVSRRVVMTNGLSNDCLVPQRS